VLIAGGFFSAELAYRLIHNGGMRGAQPALTRP